MSKLLQILLIATIAVACCHADAPRYRTARLRNRFSARQEVAAVTPYPTANELKPEVPFEEVENSVAAAAGPAIEEPHQPDETYGPPEEVDTDVQEPVAPVDEDQEEEDAVAAENDAAPAAEEEPVLVAVEEEVVASDGQVQAERLVFGRRVRGGRFIAAQPAKLRAVPVARKSARLQQQRFFVANGPFVYATRV